MNHTDLNKDCERPVRVTVQADAVRQGNLSQNHSPLPLSAFMSYGRGFFTSEALGHTQHQKEGGSQELEQNRGSQNDK